MILRLSVKARSKFNQVIKDGEGNWVIKVKAQPVEGKANEEMIRFLSKILSLSKSQIRIVSGHTNRFKTLEIDALSESEVNKALEAEKPDSLK